MRPSSTFRVFIKRCSIVAAAAACLHSPAVAKEASYSSDEEAFLIRRIAEFWKDGDFAIVKSQILDFVKKYPNSSLHDYLQGVLGDLYLQENNYTEALKAYQKIHDSAVLEKVILNKLQCYYELDQYMPLFSEGERYLGYNSKEFQDRKNEFHFVMAESYFRYSLTLSSEEDKLSFVAKAQPFYEGLLQSEYSEISSFALAEVYRQLKQNAKGAELYVTLAMKHPEKKENLLFNAALLQANYDKLGALALFDQIILMNGPKAHESAYNRLLLYFQTENYQGVVQTQRQVYPYVPEEHLAVFNYIVGKSYYALQDFDSATTPIEKFLIEQKAPSDQLKDALLIQMTCARQINNEPLFEKSLVRFKEYYPNDEEISKAHFMHAMILKNEGHLGKVEQELKIILDDYSNFSDRESLLYEYAVVTHQNGKYDISYEAFKDFLNQFPKSERCESAWRHFLSSCLHLSKDANETSSYQYSRSTFFSDLNKVLSSNNGLTSEEIREYKLLYAKLAYELGYYNESLEKLENYIQVYPNHETVAEAHLLTALSLNQLSSDLEKFCSHLELAIQLNPESYDTSSVHLQLYNAYLERAERDSNNPAFLDKAAIYLYTALQDASQPVKIENQLWLAGYFYKHAKAYLDANWAYTVSDKQEITTDVNRAFEIYSQALGSDKFVLKLIDSKSLYLEPEILKFAEICGLKGKTDKKLLVLQALIEQQNTNPDWNWQFRRQALYELARSYEIVNDRESALETYQFINAEAQNVATPITTASNLQTAKLRFELMGKNQKNEKNPDIINILNQLKELQIRKNVLSEPYHLEAALEYAKVRTALSDDSMKDSRQLFFLFRVKEDFASEEDVIGEEYHRALRSSPHKQRIYNAYLTFVDAEIYRLQSKQMLAESKKDEANRLKEKSYALLTQLERDGAPTPYLQAEVQKSLKLVK